MQILRLIYEETWEDEGGAEHAVNCEVQIDRAVLDAEMDPAQFLMNEVGRMMLQADAARPVTPAAPTPDKPEPETAA